MGRKQKWSLGKAYRKCKADTSANVLPSSPWRVISIGHMRPAWGFTVTASVSQVCLPKVRTVRPRFPNTCLTQVCYIITHFLKKGLQPRGIEGRGRWEGGSGWGIHVYPWLIHVNVWQKPLQYCKVISHQLIKKKKRKKESSLKKGTSSVWNESQGSQTNGTFVVPEVIGSHAV